MSHSDPRTDTCKLYARITFLVAASNHIRAGTCPKRRAERVVWVEREDLLHVRLARGRERVGEGLVPVRDKDEQVRVGVQIEGSEQRVWRAVSGLVRRTQGTTIALAGGGLTFVQVGARHERDVRDLALRDAFGRQIREGPPGSR